MANYYFLTTLLPELQIGVEPDIDFAELNRLMKENLKPKDYALTRVIRRYYDIENMRALWQGEEHDRYGNLAVQDLEEALLYPELLPPYARGFLETYPHKAERLRYFAALVADYFRAESAAGAGFVKAYLQFERQLRLIQAAFRAKHLPRDLKGELQFESPEEDFIEQLLAQADAKMFSPPEGYEPLTAIFAEYAEAPLELYGALLEFQFQKIDSFVGPDPFSIDTILAYMVKLILLEKWLRLDRQKGISIIDRHVKEQI